MSRYAGKKTGKKIADEETAQKIIAALENESIKYETYFKLIIATGMRRGECCALQWRDIDREQLNIHSLRHTAASLMIAGGADMATAAGILGHSQLSATLDIYTHITDDMQRAAAENIDRGIGKAAPQEDASEPGWETAPAQAEKPSMTDFKPYVGCKRRSGTGCVTEINDHLFEGRYSPKWPDGKKHARNVYAHTREECEEKLKVLIVEMNEERKNLKEQLAGIAPPEKLTKKQRKLWDYMRLHPEVTEFSTLAKRTGLARNTVKKHYGMVAAMLGRK